MNPNLIHPGNLAANNDHTPIHLSSHPPFSLRIMPSHILDLNLQLKRRNTGEFRNIPQYAELNLIPVT